MMFVRIIHRSWPSATASPSHHDNVALLFFLTKINLYAIWFKGTISYIFELMCKAPPMRLERLNHAFASLFFIPQTMFFLFVESRRLVRIQNGWAIKWRGLCVSSLLSVCYLITTHLCSYVTQRLVTPFRDTKGGWMLCQLNMTSIWRWHYNKFYSFLSPSS